MLITSLGREIMKILMTTFAAAFLLCTIPLSSAHAQIDSKQNCFVSVGKMDTPGVSEGLAVAVKGHFAYVVGSGLELQVIDISTPESPVLMSALGPPGHAHGVTVAGN
jgi:hypothetical protein